MTEEMMVMTPPERVRVKKSSWTLGYASSFFILDSISDAMLAYAAWGAQAGAEGRCL